MTILAIQNVGKKFGGLSALDDISFQVPENEIVAIIGPNGAGKTTLFNVISGFLRPSSGTILYRGASIANISPNRLAAAGIVRTFQLVRLFKNMSVSENVSAGAHLRTRGGAISALCRPAWFRQQERAVAKKSGELLEWVGLYEKRNASASELTYGQQRSLEIARALASDPKVLLLDEPAASLTALETDQLAAAIMRINGAGITILLIEHDMGLVMRVAKTVVVLDFGRKIAMGRPEVIARDPAVLAAYLGTAEESTDA